MIDIRGVPAPHAVGRVPRVAGTGRFYFPVAVVGVILREGEKGREREVRTRRGSAQSGNGCGGPAEERQENFVRT